MVGLVGHRARVVPVGRLDADTTGALLLTNDGELAHRLAHPRYEVEKVYVADVEGIRRPAALAALERGVELDDGRTAPARARRLGRGRVELASTRAASTRSSGCSPRSAIRSGGSTGSLYGPLTLDGPRARRLARADPAEVDALRGGA